MTCLQCGRKSSPRLQAKFASEPDTWRLEWREINDQPSWLQPDDPRWRELVMIRECIGCGLEVVARRHEFREHQMPRHAKCPRCVTGNWVTDKLEKQARRMLAKAARIRLSPKDKCRTMIGGKGRCPCCGFRICLAFVESNQTDRLFCQRCHFTLHVDATWLPGWANAASPLATPGWSCTQAFTDENGRLWEWQSSEHEGSRIITLCECGRQLETSVLASGCDDIFTGHSCKPHGRRRQILHVPDELRKPAVEAARARLNRITEECAKQGIVRDAFGF